MVTHHVRRVLSNLRRPLPDFLAYLCAKIASIFWKWSLQNVGRGFHVSGGALIQGGEHIRIGNNFVAGRMLWIEAVREYAGQRFTPCIDIGHNVQCSQAVHIAANVRVVVGDGALFGSRVHITDHGHGNYHGDVQDRPDMPPACRRLSNGRPVTIGANVWLGDGVVVLPGVTIGEGCIVGANSVVSRDLPARVIAVGAPAVPIKRFEVESGRWLPIAAPV